MVPFLDSPAYPRTQATIMVGSVSTRLEPQTSVGPIVTPEDLKFALTEALKKSDMFSAVGEGSTDYRVTAEILSQQVSPGIEADAVLLVQYILFDAHSNTAIFQKNLFSQVSRHRGFGDELPLVVEAAVRDSLIQFIEAVAATIRLK
jgi:hypothetical protein